MADINARADFRCEKVQTGRIVRHGKMAAMKGSSGEYPVRKDGGEPERKAPLMQ